MLGPDFGQHLSPGCYRLGLEGLQRGASEDFSRHQSLEQVLQSDGVHHRQLSVPVYHQLQRSAVASILEPVEVVPHSILHSSHADGPWLQKFNLQPVVCGERNISLSVDE